MTAFMYSKALESIEEFGFVDPITCTADYVIIDGEHRWKAARDLGYAKVPVTVIDGLTDDGYRKLTVVLNELRGQADPTKLSDLLSNLLEGSTVEELVHSLPYTEDILQGYLGFRDLELPPAPGRSGATQGSDGSPAKEPWVERLFKVPNSVGYLIDDALARAREQYYSETGEKIADWQALERIIAEYMAS